MTSDIFMILLIIIGLYFYFIPSIIARKTKYLNGILILNIFLGWTFLGWVAALIWAVSAPKVRVDLHNYSQNKGEFTFQEKFVFFMNNLFMRTDTKIEHENGEVNMLMSRIKSGEAIIRNKHTDNYEIVTADTWSKIVEAKKDKDYEIVDEK